MNELEMTQKLHQEAIEAIANGVIEKAR